MLDKQEIMNSINGKIRESFQGLIRDVLSFLPKSIQNRGYIPTHNTLRVSPSLNGFSEKSCVVNDLASLVIHKVYSLDSYQNCFQVISENEILRSQNLNFHVILSSFIRDYLEGINPYKIVFNQERFDLLFEKYIASLLSMTYEFISICPLIGFESDVDNIMIDDGLSIRRMTNNELNEVWNLTSLSDFGGGFKLKLANTKFVIEHCSIKVKGSYAYSDSNLTPIAILAMRILKTGDFWANRQFEKILLPWMMKSTSTSGNAYSAHPLSNSYNYFLSKDEIHDLRKTYDLVKNVHKIRYETRYKYVSKAIEWFDRYFNEINIEHRFIFLMLLMEALCSENYETLYKLEHRISLIIGKDDDDRLSIVSNFHHLYDDPRKIIHGHDVEIEEKDLMIAEDYSRKLLHKYIISALNGYGRQEILKYVDAALVSENKRDEMCKIFSFNVINKEITDQAKCESLHIQFFLKEDLLSTKNELDNLEIYNPNVGFVYKLILFNDLENCFDNDLWANIVEFYKSYFKYLELLKKSADLVKNLISQELHKIKNEKDEEVWTKRYTERINKTNPAFSGDAGGKMYGIDRFLRSDKIKELPEINDDTYLFFDELSHKWDLKITLEDLSRSNKSIKDIVEEIHNLVKEQSIINEFRESRVQNLKLSAKLIELLSKNTTQGSAILRR